MTLLPERSHMAAEFREAPEIVRRQESVLAAPLRDLTAYLRRHPPRVVVTCARGSSAHAASFAKHSIERHLGIPVASAAPSIVTVYRRDLKLDGQLFLAISQSGASDDLIEQAASAKAAGAVTVALTNATDSALAKMCDVVLPMAAGPEVSVAATKSFVATLTAILRLTALWANDESLQRALTRLPDRLALAAELDWSTACGALKTASSMMTIGRGPTFAIAGEAALKLKETCHLHAEAFSGAEFLHGPVTLVCPHYPILVFMPGDSAADALHALAADLRSKQAALFTTESGDWGQAYLPVLDSDHSETDAICLVQSFYAMAVRLAELRGHDADRPRHLQKVTRTR